MAIKKESPTLKDREVLQSRGRLHTSDSTAVEPRVNLSLNEFIVAIKNLTEEDREFVLENLEAALSSEYVKSIEDARLDYQEGRILSHEEVFE